MAVDLSELVGVVRAESSPPGLDLYASSTDDDWLLRLTSAFWKARLAGLFTNFTASVDGSVTPIVGDEDLSREKQQLIVVFAAYQVLLTAMQNFTAMTRSKAGPVEVEVQKSATVLRDTLAAVREDLKGLVNQALLGEPAASQTTVYNALFLRNDSLGDGDTWWVR